VFIRLFSIFIIFFSITEAANAQSYVGGSFNLIAYKDSDVGDSFNVSGDQVSADADLGNLNLTLGYNFNRWVSLETRIGLGIFSDNFLPNEPVELSIDKQYGIYSLFYITDELERLSPYLMLGYTITKAELEFTDTGVSFSKTEKDLSYGVGLDVELNEEFSFGVEFSQLIKANTFEIRSINIDITRKF